MWMKFYELKSEVSKRLPAVAAVELGAKRLPTSRAEPQSAHCWTFRGGTKMTREAINEGIPHCLRQAHLA